MRLAPFPLVLVLSALLILFVVGTSVAIDKNLDANNPGSLEEPPPDKRNHKEIVPLPFLTRENFTEFTDGKSILINFCLPKVRERRHGQFEDCVLRCDERHCVVVMSGTSTKGRITQDATAFLFLRNTESRLRTNKQGFLRARSRFCPFDQNQFDNCRCRLFDAGGQNAV